jgi:hypothetical protein
MLVLLIERYVYTTCMVLVADISSDAVHEIKLGSGRDNSWSV